MAIALNTLAYQTVRVINTCTIQNTYIILYLFLYIIFIIIKQIHVVLINSMFH